MTSGLASAKQAKLHPILWRQVFSGEGAEAFRQDPRRLSRDLAYRQNLLPPSSPGVILLQ